MWEEDGEEFVCGKRLVRTSRKRVWDKGGEEFKGGRECVGGGRDETVRLWYQYRESNFKLYSLLPSN